MGDHFEMAMAVFLKDDIAPDVLAAIRYMVGSRDDAEKEPPPKPFPDEDPLRSMNDGKLMRRFSSYEPSSKYPESVAGLRIRDAEGYLYDGGAARFPGEYGAALRKVYRHNLPVSQGGGPVYGWMLSFRATHDMDLFADYFELARSLAGYSATEGLAGYFRFQHDNTPTLLYCKGGELLAYEVEWDPARLQSLKRG